MSAAVSARSDDEQILHFAPRDFVLIGMPYRRPPGGVYERRNGNFRFRIVADPDFGVPHGQDRLIPFWIASAYRAQGCPESRTVVFRSIGDILNCYGIERHGIQYRRLRQRIERVYGATYFAYDETPASGLSTELRRQFRRQGSTPETAKGFLRTESYRLIERLQLWFHGGSRPNQYTLWQNQITLTEAFARDIRDNAIPVDIETIRALRTRSVALDLYVWQAWRSWRVHVERRRPVYVPIRGPVGLLAQLGTETERERDAYRQLFRAQQMIEAVWADCPNEIDGDRFIVRAGLAMRPNRKLILPGVSNPPSDAGTLDPAGAQVLPLVLERGTDTH
jgi:hypothetical protein